MLIPYFFINSTQTEVDVNTQEPLDKLTPMCKDWIEKNSGCTVNTLPDVLNELYKKKNKQVPNLLNLLKANLILLTNLKIFAPLANSSHSKWN